MTKEKLFTEKQIEQVSELMENVFENDKFYDITIELGKIATTNRNPNEQQREDVNTDIYANLTGAIQTAIEETLKGYTQDDIDHFFAPAPLDDND